MRSWIPYAASFVAVLLLMMVLSWPMPLYINDWHMVTMFGDNHAWALDRATRALLQGDLPLSTSEAGYPQVRDLRIVAWGPLLLSALPRLVLSPVGAFNLVSLLALPLSAIAAAALLRRWTDADAWTSAALGVVYAMCPTLLATYAMGELSTTAAWILPGLLLALDAAVNRPQMLWALAGFILLAAFTSPYYALAAPLLGLGWAIWVGRAAILRAGGLNEHAGEALRPVLKVVIVLVISLLPALVYYAPHLHQGHESHSIFRPSEARGDETRLPTPSPVARPHALLWQSGGTGPSRRPDAQHSVYLGLGLLGAAVGLTAWRGSRGGRGAREGVALAVAGVILAMGPRLGWGEGYVKVGGWALSLPVALLEGLGYPTATGGMYFRFTVIAVLGLVVMVAAGLSRLPRAALWAGGLALLQVGDAVRATSALWPRPGEAVPALAQLKALRGEDDGAVLDLPLQGTVGGRLGSEALLRATVHGRPTSALPRDLEMGENLAQKIVDEAGSGTRPRQVLREAGFRYVVLPMSRVRDLSSAEQVFVAKLGSPVSTGDLRIWDLGPTSERSVGLQQWASQVQSGASGTTGAPAGGAPGAQPSASPSAPPSRGAPSSNLPPLPAAGPPSTNTSPAARAKPPPPGGR